MGFYCVAFNCKSKQSSGNKSLQFHKFPHKDSKLLKQWDHAVRRNKWKPTKYSRLCSKHFTVTDYQIRPGAEIKWLRKDAVPTIFEFPKPLQETVKKRRLLVRKDVAVPSTSHDFLIQDINMNNEVSFQETASHVTESSTQTDNQFSNFSQCSQLPSPTKENLRKKIKLLQNKLRRRDEKMVTMKSLIAVLKKKGYSDDNLNSVLEKHFSGFSLNFFKNEIKNKNVPASGRRYSTTFKEFALTMYFYSPKAYRYVRRLIKLPHPSVIKNWLSNVNCEPGLIKEVFDYLKIQTVKKAHLKNCSLIFDSMAIRKQMSWNDKLGKYSGFIDYGGISNENLATEALVLQIVSLTQNFKCPIGYFLIDKICANVQSEIVKMSLSKLHEVGVQVHSVTCDGTSTNIKTLKLLGCISTEGGEINCFFNHPTAKTKVFAILDPCHMLKLARNTLSDKGCILSLKGEIKWSFIVKLNNLQLNEGLKLANALSNSHIKYANKKMNVKLAAQTLSSGVADALEYLKKINQ